MGSSEYKQVILKRTYTFGLETIVLVKKIAQSKKYDIAFEVIAKQLIRCATSVGANVFEAQASPTKKDFAQFITHALKSGNESKFWLLLLKDTEPKSKPEVERLIKEIVEITKILGSTVKTIRKNLEK